MYPYQSHDIYKRIQHKRLSHHFQTEAKLFVPLHREIAPWPEKTQHGKSVAFLRQLATATTATSITNNPPQKTNVSETQTLPQNTTFWLYCYSTVITSSARSCIKSFSHRWPWAVKVGPPQGDLKTSVYRTVSTSSLVRSWAFTLVHGLWRTFKTEENKSIARS